MNDINWFEDKNKFFQGFRRNIDYAVEKKGKEVNYTFYNKELKDSLLKQWHKEGFFNDDFLKKTIISSSVLESCDKNKSQIRWNLKAVNFEESNRESFEVTKDFSVKLGREIGKDFEIPKENLSVTTDVDNSSTALQRTDKGKDRFYREGYYKLRIEEDKNQLLEQGKKRREKEKSQLESSTNSNKKEQKLEREVNQQNLSQSKDNTLTTNTVRNCTVGVCSLLLISVGIIVVAKKKR